MKKASHQTISLYDSISMKYPEVSKLQRQITGDLGLEEMRVGGKAKGAWGLFLR